MMKKSQTNGKVFIPKPAAMLICEEGLFCCAQSEDGKEKDYASALLQALSEYFEMFPLVTRGEDVLPALLNGIPPVIVISRTIPDIDPISLIRNLRLSAYCLDIRFFLCCQTVNDSVRSICTANRIDAAFSIDDDVMDTANSIHKAYLAAESEKTENRIRNLRAFIDDILYFNDPTRDSRLVSSVKETILEPIGLDMDHKGTKYLELIICLRVLGCGGSLSELYSACAETMKTSPSAVEKSIRYAIEKAWERSSPYMQYYLFGNTVDASKGKPTNAEFIATTSQHIKDSLIRRMPIGTLE